jgi:hypothetical protein
MIAPAIRSHFRKVNPSSVSVIAVTEVFTFFEQP